MTVLAVGTVLAATSSSTSAWNYPGVLGFLVVFGMGVVLYFVFRSLAKHLRKVNEAARIEAEREEAGQAQSGEAQSGEAHSGHAQADGQVLGPAAKNGSAPRS